MLKLPLSVMDQEQPAAICGPAVLENIIINGKAHSDESSGQRAIALTMNVGGGGGGCLPHLSSARLYYLGSSKNGWKSVLERMDRGCLGFGERLEIDQANGGEGRKPRPWASGQKVQSLAACLHLLFPVQHMARQASLLISYFIQLYNYCTNPP